MITSLGIFVFLLQAPTSSAEAREAVRSICNTVTDDDATRNELIHRLDSLGESGKRVLLRVGAPGSGSQSWERGCAWQQLTRLKDERVVGLLRAALKDAHESADNRRIAFQALGDWGDRDSVAELAAHLESADALDRAAAARALGFIASEEAREALHAALQSGRDKAYPWAIVEALGRHRDPTVITQLRNLSADMAPGEAYQRIIAEALARIGTAESLDTLESVVERMPSGLTRHYSIIGALAELRRIGKESEDSTLRQRREQAIARLALLGR